MSDLLHQELIRQAVEAAREGDRETALNNLKEVLEEDEENVTAWFLLARLSSDPEEKRLALTTVLSLKPGHEKAQALLEKLESRGKPAKPPSEVIPGVSRRALFMVIGAIAAVFLILIVIVMAISSGKKNREAEQEREVQQLLAGQTQTQDARTQVVHVTETADFFLTETQWAIISPTPSPSNTSSAPTLPPTFTPTPEIVATQPELLPPPAGITGIISGWGGPDLANTGALPVVLYRMTGEAAYVTPDVITEERGRYGSLSSSFDWIVYAVRERQFYDVVMIDLEGTRLASQLDSAPALGGYTEASMPVFSADGTQIVYVAETLNDPSYEVFMLDVSSEEPVAPVRLTTDTANYSFPAFSPDGTRVVAVRENPTSLENPGPDLVIIDLRSRTLSPLTTDNQATLETMPRWSPEGVIVYAATTEDAPNSHDLYLISPDNPGAGVMLLDEPADVVYPVFSPDGQYVAFSSDLIDGYDIFILDLNTHDVFQVTNSRDADYPTSWVEFSERGGTEDNTEE